MIQTTGIKVTQDELAEVLKRSQGVKETPLVKVHRRSLADDARETFMGWLDDLAVKHGLPATEKTADGNINHYGMTSDGEFTRWIDDGVEKP